MTSLITPFRDDKVDFDALVDLVDWQIEQGAQGLVVCGATGESPTLSHSEWGDVVRSCVGATHRRVPVIAGSGTNDTRRTVDLTNEAARLGVDAALVVTPYYNKPGQEGLFRHFDSVGRASDLPIIIHNAPARTAVDIGLDTLERLAEVPGIVALADATGELARIDAATARFGDRFILLSGHDGSMQSFMAAGGDGVISVIANAVPALIAMMIGATRRGDPEEARRIQANLFPLLEALELEINPGPIKFALHCMRGYSPRLRLPLVEVADAVAQKIRDALALVNVPATDVSMAGHQFPIVSQVETGTKL